MKPQATEQRHIIGEFDYQGSDEYGPSSSEDGGNLKKALRKVLNEQAMTRKQAGRLSGTSRSSINNALLGKSMWKRTEKRLWDFIKERSQSDSEETPTQRRIRIGTENFRKANLKRMEQSEEKRMKLLKPFTPALRNNPEEAFRTFVSALNKTVFDEDQKYQLLGRIAVTLFSTSTHK